MKKTVTVKNADAVMSERSLN